MGVMVCGVHVLTWIACGINLFGIYSNIKRRRELDRKHSEVDELRGKARQRMALMEQMHIHVLAIGDDGPLPRRTNDAPS
jgi:hypothetical protein